MLLYSWKRCFISSAYKHASGTASRIRSAVCIRENRDTAGILLSDLMILVKSAVTVT